MSGIQHSDPVSRIIDEWLVSNGDKSWPVSVAAVVSALRCALGQGNVSDRELADAVARRAIERSYDVAFDLPHAA